MECMLFLLMLMSLFSFSTPLQSPVPPDLQSLLAFKAAITSDPNNSLANWNASIPMCNWTGVTCSHNSQRVVELGLGDMDLQGFISPALGNLTSLVNLILPYNQLHGSIPDELGKLTGLVNLFLVGNYFTGTVPLFIKNFSALDQLDLSQNNLHGPIPPEIGMLTRLRYLYLYANQLSGSIPSSIGNLSQLIALQLLENSLAGPIPPEIGNLAQLDQLVLSGNQLSGTIPSELGRLINLQELKLWGNELSGNIPNSLGNCSKPQRLVLSGNQLSGTIPPELGMLTRLRYLHLYANQLSGSIPSSIGNLSQLIALQLLGNSLAGPIPPEIGNLAQLEQLELSENNLTGTIPREIGNLTQLDQLVLSGNQLSGTIPSDLGMLINLQELYLWGNELSGNIPNSLGNCSKMEVLDLRNNLLRGAVPNELGKLVLLQYIILEHNQLVSSSNTPLPFLTALTNCSHLEYIKMSYNHLSGILPPSIGNLSSNLSILDFGNNKIRGKIPEQITGLTNLTWLRLSNNLLSGYLPSGLKRLDKLERLDLSGNSIGGRLQEDIGEMKSLGELDVSWNKLSGRIPGSLGRLQQLRRLFLHHNHFSGEIPSGLQHCPNLELVDFSHNHLIGNIPGGVMTSLKNLQFYLNLSSNFLQGPLPAEISKIVSAQAIDITCNKLDGMIPSALANCLALEHLNLSHNAFEGPIPDALGKLQNLESVDLSFNFLSGTIPTSLTKMKVLRYINACFNNLTGEVPKGGLFSNDTFNASFMGNPGLCGPEKYLVHACPNQGKRLKSLLTKIMLPAAGMIAFLLCTSIVGILWCRKYSSHQFDLPEFMIGRLRYPKFTYQDLVNATNGFSETNLLGVGSFGSVFKGILRDGMIVAIKVLNFQNDEPQTSFKRECKILARTRHRNLIRVISACSYLNFKALILQFATNGSLEKNLYPESNEEDICDLKIDECLSIAIDVAHGMEYLHHDCPTQVVHCDLKPSNVLLDANLTALVADFGISRLAGPTNLIDSLSTSIGMRGSIGYIAPEYGLGMNISTKGDVYSYGIILLEMVTRKRPTDAIFADDMNLPKWVRSAFPERLADIVDRRLLENVEMEHNECLVSFIHIGLLCTTESPQERPTMRDVRSALEVVRTSLVGGATSTSNLARTISDLLLNASANATGEGVSASGSSSY